MENIKLYAFADEASKDLSLQIAAMKRNNLNGLEIRNVDGQSIIDVTNEKARQIRRDMDAAGLQVYTIGSPVGKIDIETGDWETHKEKFKHLLEVTEILGAENMRIFSFFIPKGKDPENYRNEVIDRLGWLLEQAKGVVELCHENEKEIYGDIASRCLTLYQTLPSLRAIFDPANFIQSGQPTLPAWEMLHSYIKYMHIKDALNDGKVVPPGCGEGHLREIIPAYLKQGGTCFTVEPHLALFDGLAALEREEVSDKVGNTYSFASKDEAFDTACTALKNILKEIQ